MTSVNEAWAGMPSGVLAEDPALEQNICISGGRMKPIRERWSAMSRALVTAVIWTMLSATIPQPLNAKTYEVPHDRQVAEILPADMIQGPHYRIRDTVVSYGYMLRYTVDSDFGTFEVTGDGALRKLLKEIRAIAQLQQIQRTDAFAAALKEAAKKPVKFG